MRARPAVGLLLVLTAVSAVQAQTPSTDLDSYALFAINDLRSRAMVVTDGNVGVNAGGGQLYSVYGVIAPLSEVAASRARLPAASDCKILFSNSVPLRSCGSRRQFVSPFLNASAVNAACGFPNPFPSCGGSDVTIAPAQVFRLPAGSYRNVVVRGGVLPGRLILTGGRYNFCSLKTSRNSDVLFDSASQVFIDGDLDVGGTGFGGTGGEDVGAQKIRVLVNGAKVRVRPKARLFGRLCAPNAKMKLRWGVKLFGSFVARDIRTDKITIRALPAGTPGSTTTTTTTRPPTSTTGTTTTTTRPVNTSTTTTSTTSTTGPGVGCGNGRIDPGEACDPPNAVVCPSPGGAFSACGQDCICPGRVDTRCCLPPSPAGGFIGCELLKPAECAQQGGVLLGLGSCDPTPCTGISFPTTTTLRPTTTTTTRPSTTTTTSLRPGSTTTTTRSTVATTTSTTPTLPIAAKEICGNCEDDDGNGATDFEDAACCAGGQRFDMTVRNGRIRPRGATSALKLQSALTPAGLSGIDPLRQDVYVQIRANGGRQLFCARVPATNFKRKHGAFLFLDRQHAVASAMGLDDMSVKVRRNGKITFRTHGRRVRLSGASQGLLHITVGFRDAAQVESASRCSAVNQRFRTKAGALRAP